MENVIEGNKLIAEFMGYTHIKDNVLYDTCTDYQYKHYTYETIYSETPIHVDSEDFLQEVKNPDYGNKENPRWNPELETLGWASVNKHFINPKYHTSFDWLMPVVEKIKNSGDYNSKRYLANNGELASLLISEIENALICIDITRLWLAVIEFIKWYNLQNK